MFLFILSNPFNCVPLHHSCIKMAGKTLLMLIQGQSVSQLITWLCQIAGAALLSDRDKLERENDDLKQCLKMIIKQSQAFTKLLSLGEVPRKGKRDSLYLAKRANGKIKCQPQHILCQFKWLKANLAQRVFGSYAVKCMTLFPATDL